jgi:transcriptional regulator with XRE-family HTH domain
MSVGATIGERLKQARARQQMTAKELSGLSGVPEKTIYRIETGEVKDPRLSSIKPLLQHLNCTADEILFGMDEFYSLGTLKQVFMGASSMHESNLETLIDVARAIQLYDRIQTSELVPVKELV